MNPSQLPLGLQYVQAFGPSFVAIVAALIAGYIAWRQWKTAHTRLKLDLFNERYAIFKVLDEINRAWTAARKVEGDNWVGDYLARMREATDKILRFQLLFPRDVGEKIDELVEAWHDFVTAKAEEDSFRSTPRWPDHVKKLRRLWDRVGEQNKALRKKIENDIRPDFGA